MTRETISSAGAEPSQEASNFCQRPNPLTRLQRLGRRLFPQQHVDWPEPQPPLGHGDGYFARVTWEPSFCERLKLLVSGRLQVTLKMASEFRIGVHVTNTGVDVLPPKLLDTPDQ